MSGNKAEHDAAMKRAYESAKSGDWEGALHEYERALAEFEDDLTAKTNLSLVQFRLERWQEALPLHEDLSRLLPTNAAIHGRLAVIYARTEAVDRAADTFVKAANLYARDGQPQSAIQVLQQALQLPSPPVAARERLAELYGQEGNVQASVAERLALARYHAGRNEPGAAQRQCQAALALDPNNREVTELLSDLKPAPIPEALPVPAMAAIPVVARQKAALSPSQVDEQLAEAQRAQEQGQPSVAIERYEGLLSSGVERSDLAYNLGLLYQQQGRFREAVDCLTRATHDKEYSVSAYYGLGECYRHLGRLEEAAAAFHRALQELDLSSVRRSDEQELIQIHERAAEAYLALENHGRAGGIYAQLADFLEARLWRSPRAAEFRRKADQLTERSMYEKIRFIGATGDLLSSDYDDDDEPELSSQQDDREPGPREPTVRSPRTVRRITQARVTDPGRRPSGGAAAGLSLPDQLPMLDPGAGEEERRAVIQKWMDVAKKYLEADLYSAASDATLQVINFEPLYTPAHLMLADVQFRRGRPEEAVSKLKSMLSLFLVRSEREAMVDCYQRILAIAPHDTEAREGAVDLLVSNDKKPGAIALLVDLVCRCIEAGNVDGARAAWEKLARLDPGNPRIPVLDVRLTVQSGHADQALNMLASIKHGDMDPEILAARHVALVVAGREEAKWAAFETMLASASSSADNARAMLPDYRGAAGRWSDVDLWCALGIVMYKSGKHQEAIQILGGTLDDLPQGFDAIELEARWALAQAYVAAGEPSSALKELDECSSLASRVTLSLRAFERLSPAGAPFVQVVGEFSAGVCRAAGDLEEAIHSLAGISSLPDYDVSVHRLLAEFYFDAGKPDQAVRELEMILERANSPEQVARATDLLRLVASGANEPRVSTLLAHSYLRRGLPRDGVAELKRLAAALHDRGQMADLVRTLLLMAEVYLGLGAQAQAMEICDSASRICPDDLLIRQQLAYANLEGGRGREALAELWKVADSASRAGKNRDVMGALLQILTIAPEDRAGLRRLGDMWGAAGAYERAAAMYDRLLRLDPENAEIAGLRDGMLSRAEQSRAPLVAAGDK